MVGSQSLCLVRSVVTMAAESWYILFLTPAIFTFPFFEDTGSLDTNAASDIKLLYGDRGTKVEPEE